MYLMQDTCEKAGLPLEPSKTVGPATTLVFLGIELDSLQMILRVPPDKLTNIKEAVRRWKGSKACRKCNLLVLIGLLSHASKVVYTSRIFLHRLIDLSTTAKSLDHFIRLNADTRSDLQWWVHFIESWNGIAMLLSVTKQPPDFISQRMLQVKEITHFLHCLEFIQASFQCQLKAYHLLGTHNRIADALSRNNLPLFHALYPQADKAPSAIPPDLILLLVLERPDWTLHRWTMLWSSIFWKDW